MLGTNIGNTQKEVRVSQVTFQPVETLATLRDKLLVVQKRLFAAVFILKTIALPRQARDKHRKS
jgi:hypothetical protein